jgi:high affinity cGMP-specific 3',5'-cyclic phosphodiesterase 9
MFYLQLFPQLEEVMVKPLKDARDRYEEMKESDDKERNK